MKAIGMVAGLVLVGAACRSSSPSFENLRIWRPTRPCVLQLPTGTSATLLVGVVVDRETNCPLPQARLGFQRDVLTDTADARGIFRVSRPVSGEPELHVAKLCWQRAVVSLRAPVAEPLVVRLERAMCTV